MEANEYHASPGINASSIKHGRTSMLAMHHAMTTSKPPTPAMRWGTLMHLAILEPEKLCELPVFDGKDWRAKGAKAFREDHDGKDVVLAAEHAKLAAASDAVWSNKHAARLIEATQHEVSIKWQDDRYGLGKGRVDGCDDDLLLDLKTTKGGIDDRTLQRVVWDMGYHLQLGWYRHGLNATGRDVPLQNVMIIWAQQEPPYDVRVTQLSPGLVKRGEDEAVEIARRYYVHDMCKSYPGVSDEVGVIEPPAWAQDDTWEVE